MATKKAPAKKSSAPKKSAAKKSQPTKRETGKGVEKGSKYACDVCGMVVSVDTACGCEEVDLLCCGEQMAAQA